MTEKRKAAKKAVRLVERKRKRARKPSSNSNQIPKDVWGPPERKSIKEGDKTYKDRTAFVAMAFDKKADRSPLFLTIKRTLRKLGIVAKRVDEIGGSCSIIDTIKIMIEDAQYLIFDITKERPNVYYELGYAHAAGNGPEEVIILAKKGTKLHFDIQSLSVKYYSSYRDLEAILREEIKKMKAYKTTRRKTSR